MKMLVKKEERNVKCTLVGDGMVGKTCLALAFSKACSPDDYVATVFENYAGKAILNGDEYTVSIFDTAGQHDYESLREFTYKESEVFVVCYSVADRESFDNILEFWLPEMKMNMPRKKPILLVGTQMDLRNTAAYDSDIPVTSEEGIKLSKDIGAVAFIECSIHDMNAIRKVFLNIVEAGLKYRKRKLSIVHKIMGK